MKRSLLSRMHMNTYNIFFSLVSLFLLISQKFSCNYFDTLNSKRVASTKFPGYYAEHLRLL